MTHNSLFPRGDTMSGFRFSKSLSMLSLVLLIATCGLPMVSCGGDVNNDGDVTDVQTEEDTTVGVDAVTSATKFVCTVCNYVYDPAVGDPAQGVPAGTSFYDLPEAWTCPQCGAAQSLFEVQH